MDCVAVADGFEAVADLELSAQSEAVVEFPGSQTAT